MTERDPNEIVPDVQQEASSADAQELAPGDFYYEGPYMVFTESYHLKRGYCCNSGCRHCPYR